MIMMAMRKDYGIDILQTNSQFLCIRNKAAGFSRIKQDTLVILFYVKR